MNERLDCLLRIYRVNESLLIRNPIAWDIMYEQQIIYDKMMECIPQEHCDEINLIVYGIRRVR